MLDQGWSIADVADRLGHANPAITARIYSHAMRHRQHDLSFLDADLGNFGQHDGQIRSRAARVDSTVVEADVRYPTDSGLALPRPLPDHRLP